MRDSDSTVGERFYPNYKLGSDGIAIKEYEFAAQSVQNEEKIYTTASSVFAALFAILSSLAWGDLHARISIIVGEQTEIYTLYILVLILFVATYFAISLISNLRKNYAYACRKLIILRMMLGQSYGATHLVLPNWRAEGADIPYSIKMFPGWRIWQALPFYAIISLSSTIAYIILVTATDSGRYANSFFSTTLFHIPAVVAWATIFLVIARSSLFDDHEDFILTIARALSRFLAVTLTGKYEYILYRARLARAEAHRLRIDLTHLRRMAIFREDRSFLTNSGFSIKATARAIYRRIRFSEHAGGSTITQQLARSLFIERPPRTIRRKLVEIIMAIWLARQIEKAELIDIYLCSVRYEHNVMGIVAAMRYFFGEVTRTPTTAEAFVLIERISNIRGLFRESAVKRSLKQALESKVLTKEDIDEAMNIYALLVRDGKLRNENA